MTADNARRYMRFWETMTPQSLGELDSLVTADVHFRDPFHDLHGVAEMRRMLERMFEHLEAPRLVVTDSAEANGLWMLRWTFDARTKKSGSAWHIVGMSELACAPDGRIRQHIDHWDAARQFYEDLPLLGAVLRAIRRRLSA